jgi:hypothetical protein
MASVDYNNQPIRALLDLIVKGNLPSAYVRWQSDYYEIYGTGEWAVTATEVINWFKDAKEGDRETYCSVTASNVKQFFRKIAQRGPSIQYTNNSTLKWYKVLKGIPIHEGPTREKLNHILPERLAGGWAKNPYIHIKEIGPFKVESLDTLYKVDTVPLLGRLKAMKLKEFRKRLWEFHNCGDKQQSREKEPSWWRIYDNLQLLDNVNNLDEIKTPQDFATLKAKSQQSGRPRSLSPRSGGTGPPAPS